MNRKVTECKHCVYAREPCNKDFDVVGCRRSMDNENAEMFYRGWYKNGQMIVNGILYPSDTPSCRAFVMSDEYLLMKKVLEDI